jgi:hypothetical protein
MKMLLLGHIAASFIFRADSYMFRVKLGGGAASKSPPTHGMAVLSVLN